MLALGGTNMIDPAKSPTLVVDGKEVLHNDNAAMFIIGVLRHNKKKQHAHAFHQLYLTM